MEEVRVDGIVFRSHDLGGHLAARRLWRNYFGTIDAVVFLVDTTDHIRLPEVRQELRQLLEDEHLQAVPFLVLGNKIDLPNALREDQFKRCVARLVRGEWKFVCFV